MLCICIQISAHSLFGQTPLGLSVLNKHKYIHMFLIKHYFIGARGSRLLKHASDKIYSILGKEKVAFNHHSHGVKTETYTKHKRLRDFFQVISTNIDEFGYEFVSTIEGKGPPATN